MVPINYLYISKYLMKFSKHLRVNNRIYLILTHLKKKNDILPLPMPIEKISNFVQASFNSMQTMKYIEKTNQTCKKCN